MQAQSPLIDSTRVNGADVYGKSGKRVCKIDHLMIDKQSGKVAYAVMSFGGFLGLGSDTHPIPWDKLTYDTQHDGYATSITEEQLQTAPQRQSGWAEDRGYEQRLFSHYGASPYWF